MIWVHEHRHYTRYATVGFLICVGAGMGSSKGGDYSLLFSSGAIGFIQTEIPNELAGWLAG